MVAAVVELLGLAAEGTAGDGTTHLTWVQVARGAATVALFLAAVHASTGRPGAALVRWSGLAAIVSRFPLLLGPELSDGLRATIAATGAVFLVLATSVLLIHLMRSRRVDADLLVGSLCIYLLLGFLWAEAYRVIELQPGPAFRAPDGAAVGIHDLSYFSFVTLTTLGYGDIVPVSAAAKGLAIAEAVVGQFYLAVLVARLLGLHLAAARDRA